MADVTGSKGRRKPMKVLVLGMGRTGTTTLAAGLRDLGFTPYDYVDRFLEGHSAAWDAAMHAKYKGIGAPWGRREFDAVTGNYDVILDVPCVFFTPELLAAYPSALVILNTRDEKAWYASTCATLFTVFRWRSLRFLKYTDPSLCGAWCTHNEIIWNHFCDLNYDDEKKCVRRYREHYEEVRRLVPRERLLEVQVMEGWEEDGWTEIGRFLGVEERLGEQGKDRKREVRKCGKNGREEFLREHVRAWWGMVVRSVVNVGIVAVGAGAVVGTLMFYGRKVGGDWGR